MVILFCILKSCFSENFERFPGTKVTTESNIPNLQVNSLQMATFKITVMSSNEWLLLNWHNTFAVKYFYQ